MGKLTLSEALPQELEFLRPFLNSTGPRYHGARWLGSSFDDSVWQIRTEHIFTIDWRVPVGKNGELLTSPRHCGLWEVFRCWLVLQTHVDTTGGIALAPRVEYKKLRNALTCIDYFLLNADRLGLPDHGMAALSANDVAAALAKIGSNRSLVISVYDWPRRLSDYLREAGLTLSESECNDAYSLMGKLSLHIVDPADRLTDLSDEEIIRARMWLWLRGVYNTGSNDCQYTPSTSKLAAAIFSGTLGGTISKLPLPRELCLVSGHSFETEYPRARVHSERDERMGRKRLRCYREALLSLGVLRGEGYPVPDFARGHIDALRHSLDLKELGRFRTLPHDVVFGSLRKAVEYALEYGDGLVDSYLSLAEAAQNAGTSFTVFGHANDITHWLTPGTHAMGVRRWVIANPARLSRTSNLTRRAEYFRDLRNNVGLYECLRVLIGAVQIVVGTLMARREGELAELRVEHCLDASRTRLVFRNRKSGVMGLREVEARPIPPIGVELLAMLERLHTGLVARGILKAPGNIFAAPKRFGAKGVTSTRPAIYNGSLDYFCDWAELPLDSDGRRYYVRQHQLRRFFAMLFFWGDGFGGLETLRYFLGHTDPEHLYHYVTESVPGAVLRGVKAQYVAYGAQHAGPESDELATVLQEHFGTSEFALIDTEALELYVEDLLEEGRLIVEPQFLDGERHYRVLVKLSPRGLAGGG